MGLHASRQLSGEVLRYLKRVRVTPAVYPPFTRLNPGFRYGHWAGFGHRTHPFELAVTYVFVKQSGSPCHCDQPLPGAGTPSPEVTGPVCRVPSPGLAPRALACSARPPVSVLGTVAAVTLPPDPFHGPQGLSRTRPRRAHHAFTPFSPLRLSGGFDAWRAWLDPSAHPEASGPGPCNGDGAGILTGFPFGRSQLGAALGPAYPRLTSIAEEP